MVDEELIEIQRRAAAAGDAQTLALVAEIWRLRAAVETARAGAARKNTRGRFVEYILGRVKLELFGEYATCDGGCGAESPKRFGEELAARAAEDAGWLVLPDGKNYCPKCRQSVPAYAPS